jgi:hypothetical protein
MRSATIAFTLTQHANVMPAQKIERSHNIDPPINHARFWAGPAATGAELKGPNALGNSKSL